MPTRNHIFHSLIFSFLFLRISGQDTLHLRSGEILYAKVLEVRNELIKLKKSTNPNGPEYSYYKNDIFFIKYSNGGVDSFKIIEKPIINVEKPIVNSLVTTPTNPVFPKIAYISSRWCYFELNSTYLVKAEEGLVYAENLSTKKNISDLKKLVKQTRGNLRRKKTFAAIGLPIAAIGLTAFGFGVIFYDRDYDYQTPFYRIGGIAFSIGAGLEIVSLVNGIRKQKRMKKTFDLYNKHTDDFKP